MNIVSKKLKQRKQDKRNKQALEAVCAAFGHYRYVPGKGQVPCECKGKK